MQATIKCRPEQLDHPVLARLQTIPDPPSELFVAGQLPTGPRIAIVGSRQATVYGRQIAAQLAGKIAAAGGVVVSGLAFGIDITALQAALDVNGRCIVVLPGGLSDRLITPQTNIVVARRVLQNGALLSEYRPDQSAHKEHFLARNRLISGLAEAVVVVEGALPSGSLITSRHAAEQGRDVWAVPGPITSAVSRGTNQLLADGAFVLNDPQVFLETYQLAGQATDLPDTLLNLFTNQPTPADKLADRSGLSITEFTGKLTRLELAGLVRHVGSQHYVRS